MEKPATATPTLDALSSMSVFKIAFWSALGVYVPFIAFCMVLILADGIASPADDMPASWATFLILVGNLFLGPLIWAVFMIFGRWVYEKVYVKLDPVPLVFSGGGFCFHQLGRDSLYQMLVACGRGLMVVYGIFFGLIVLLMLLMNLLAGTLDQSAILIGFAFIAAIILLLIPYVWAFFLALGGTLMKPLTRRLGWGQLEFVTRGVNNG